MQREETAGIAGSLLFHGALALILLLWAIAEPMAPPEFVEVVWGSSALMNTPGAGLSGSAPAAPPSASSPAASDAMSVKLPERRTAKDEDLLSVPRRDKLDVGDAGRPSRGDRSSTSALDRDRPRSAGKDQSAVGTNLNSAGVTGEGTGPGTSAGSGVAMAMEWSGGGTRRKISGALPEYPPGETAEVQIRIEATVAPGGRVTAVRPVLKGNARLEDAAMKEVRKWVFEPLPPSVRQDTQLCLITFNFRLR